MSEEDVLCTRLERIQKAFESLLLATWTDRPREEFGIVVREFEAFLNLKEKLCPKRSASA